MNSLMLGSFVSFPRSIWIESSRDCENNTTGFLQGDRKNNNIGIGVAEDELGEVHGVDESVPVLGE